MGETVRCISGRCNSSSDLRNGSEGFCQLKKLEEAEESERKRKDDSASVDLNTVILAGLERGLTMTDIRRMTIGQVVDFVIDYNNRQKRSEEQAKKEEKRGKKRKATQNDINSFFG